MKLLSMMIENGFVGCDLQLMKSNFGFGFAGLVYFGERKNNI
jgi:hypothetical protein